VSTVKLVKVITFELLPTVSVYVCPDGTVYVTVEAQNSFEIIKTFVKPSDM